MCLKDAAGGEVELDLSGLTAADGNGLATLVGTPTPVDVRSTSPQGAKALKVISAKPVG